ncbi:MAG: hypothetical protein ACI8PZ_002260 [Myxococcota bacterium]|jgi:hypothetical protein
MPATCRTSRRRAIRGFLVIHRLVALLVVGAAPAWAQEAEPPPEDPLSEHRVRFDMLVDRTIGTASSPVAFNWRRTKVQVAATGSFLVELNNFNTLRAGAVVRLPTRKTIVELGLSGVEVWNTQSSRLLALTPYRQPGRPDRMELDVLVGLPLAEGVVTASPRVFPAVQLVVNAYVGVRYSLYPSGWGGMTPGQVFGAILNPGLTDIEIRNLEGARLDAMEVDRLRYGIMAGLGNDLYFEQGLFVSPRMLFSVPLLAPAVGSQLIMQVDLSLAVGVAF